MYKRFSSRAERSSAVHIFVETPEKLYTLYTYFLEIEKTSTYPQKKTHTFYSLFRIVSTSLCT